MIGTIVAMTVWLLSSAAFAGPQEDAIGALLRASFDRPDAKLVVDPIVVVEDHAVAGWSQGENGGRALLRERSGQWNLVLCSGDAIRSAEALRAAGLSTPLAAKLAEKVRQAEQAVPAERRMLLARFEGTMMMAAGEHPPAHSAQTQQAPAAARFRVGDLVIEQPWLRATPRGARVAGGYMTITNNGSEPDRLVGGLIEQASRFEVHEMTMDGTVMRMRPLRDGLTIGPGQTVELKPGGFHVMGLDLSGGFAAGQTVKGNLRFEKAGTVAIEYTVAPIGAGSPAAHH